MMSSADEILEFWFGREDEADYGKFRKVWFRKKPRFDAEIRTRFISDYQLAAASKLDSWKSLPHSCLALILLLDQFPRNIFRGTPQAFATDPQAQYYTQYAVANGYDRQLLPVQRWFTYIPFEHSENLAHQHQSVELFGQLNHEPECGESLDWAIKHLKIIERFGRFPHRNKILGRETTAEEEEFLKQPGSSF